MAIITISRELAALGDETARELARILGYRLVQKDAIERRMRESGTPDGKFARYDERKPSFLAGLSPYREDYLHFLQSAVFAEAGEGDCVLVGRGANVILGKLPALVSVFLSARIEVRVERVKGYFSCDEKRAAQIIDRSDRDRSGFHRSFFNVQWRHPGNYHLTFNTGILSPADCAETIAGIKERLFPGETEGQNREALREMLLAHRIRHRILYERELPIRFMEVFVSGRVVTLRGATNSQGLLDAAVEIAAETAGSGTELNNEIQIIREYGVMP
ncbi:MAG: cytidylate kinase family protein [Treponema sp.]|nr:cytidylate kinase family protein [Treponema sp.]